jgi:glycosyltransferase involved in cell wall biosynthesis
MHIAFLTPEYPHAKVTQAAGIGTTVKNLATALQQQGISVSVFIYGQQRVGIFVENGIKIHLIASKRYSVFTWYHYRKYLQNYINQCIESDKIDLVEAPDWTGITALMKINVPLIIRFHGTDAYFCHLEKRKQKLKNFLLEKWAIQSAKAYITPTEFAGKITKHIFRIKNKTITTIPSGLSLAQFNNPTPETYEKGMVLYIGTIIRKKGIFELPLIFEKVLDKCPEAKLIIIGSDSSDIRTGADSTWSLIQNMLNGKLISKVKYLGKIPHQEVQDYIKKANVCVFPTFAETQGMVTVESMAMHKPVVNSDKGWSREIIEDGVNGFLVNPKNHTQYAQRIIDLIQNEALCLSVGEAARVKVTDHFDIQELAKKNIDFYTLIIKQNNK